MQEQIVALFDKVASYFAVPFASWNSFLAAIGGVPDALLNIGTISAWPYLLSSMAIAYLLYLLARRQPGASPRSFRAFAFPREVYRHRSAIVDYKYVLIDLTLQGVVYVPVIAGCTWLSYKLALSLSGGAAASAGASLNPLADALILTVITFIVIDFATFFSHYLMHRFPVLWYFHEVHHSAEVMTPVTVLRVHPVEKIFNSAVGAFLGGLGAAAYAAIAGHKVDPLTVIGIDIFVFYFRVFGIHLRHSHIWLSYGTFLSHILISPAQHQIHHSVDPRHYDKNFGYVLAIWDLLFRSLYVPRQRESLQFGLAGTDPKDYSSVAALYITPFRKAMRHLRAPRSAAAEPAAPAGEAAVDLSGHKLVAPDK
ncbi:sterol desaturase family protein [Massilia cavernae]|uniref:Sterol desaturase family protein n=1 Tax=Massilia cavernae TaxID=2320864 RepID=A0A418Y8I0_9BURK|nr:sterol desaturase family protein [Massilia cavernae]RJG27561.1 sterol desaturase family protein [Massilia cavernae]